MRNHTAVVARDMMATDLRTAKAAQRVNDAVRVMLKHGISGMPVVDEDGALVGMLTQKDCIRAFMRAVDEHLPPSCVADVMTKGDLLTIHPETHVLDIAHTFLTQAVRFLPVVDGGQVVGQVTRRDLLRATIDVFDQSPDRESAVLYFSAVASSRPV